jgi:hypothetical protein
MSLLILSVDPGEIRTGYCWKLRQDAETWPTLNKGIAHADRLSEWFDDWPNWTKYPHHHFFVLCEDFIQRPGLNSEWIKQPTAKVYGAVWREADRLGATFIPTNPNELRVGATLAGIKWSGNSHLRDDLAAEAHAAYFCVHGRPQRVRSWLG